MHSSAFGSIALPLTFGSWLSFLSAFVFYFAWKFWLVLGTYIYTLLFLYPRSFYYFAKMQIYKTAKHVVITSEYNRVSFVTL